MRLLLLFFGVFSPLSHHEPFTSKKIALLECLGQVKKEPRESGFPCLAVNAFMWLLKKWMKYWFSKGSPVYWVTRSAGELSLHVNRPVVSSVTPPPQSAFPSVGKKSVTSQSYYYVHQSQMIIGRRCHGFPQYKLTFTTYYYYYYLRGRSLIMGRQGGERKLGGVSKKIFNKEGGLSKLFRLMRREMA